MSTDYTAVDGGTSTAGQSLPLVVQCPSDGDFRDVASVIAALHQLADIASGFLNYGAKRDDLNTYGAAQTFNAAVYLNREVDMHGSSLVRERPAAYLSASADQTISLTTAQRYVMTSGLSGGIVRLPTTATEGSVCYFTSLGSVGVGVWKFRRGADNTHEICTLDNSGGAGDVPGSFGFQVIGGVWRLIQACSFVVPGTYA